MERNLNELHKRIHCIFFVIGRRRGVRLHALLSAAYLGLSLSLFGLAGWWRSCFYPSGLARFRLAVGLVARIWVDCAEKLAA